MVKRDIAYGVAPLQKFDIHFPDTFSSQSPVIFLIHGGGFISGTKEDFEHQAAAFCKIGFVTVNLSHQLINANGLTTLPPVQRSSDITIFDQVSDVKLAVDFVMNSATTFGLGLNAMYMAGHSAGAVLTLLYVQGEHNIDKHIKAGANWAGLTNLSLPPKRIMAVMDPRWIELLHRATGSLPLGDNGDLYARVNPFWVTSQGNAVPVISVFPENNIIFGFSMEKELQYSYTLEYHELLKEKGVPEKLILMKGENHGFRLSANSWQRVVEDTAAFFDMVGEGY